MYYNKTQKKLRMVDTWNAYGDNDNWKLSIVKLYKIISVHLRQNHSSGFFGQRRWQKKPEDSGYESTKASPTSRVIKKLNLEKGHLWFSDKNVFMTC